MEADPRQFLVMTQELFIVTQARRWLKRFQNLIKRPSVADLVEDNQLLDYIERVHDAMHFLKEDIEELTQAHFRHVKLIKQKQQDE